jgi:hypothetical protein
MKIRVFKLSCGILAMAGAGSSPAFANSIYLLAGSGFAGWQGGSYDPFQNNQGGEFAALGVNPDGGGAVSLVAALYSPEAMYTFGAGDDSTGAFAGLTGFETFCVEGGNNDITFYPGGIYNYSFSENILGGRPMQLSVGVAWLYSQFATGTLAGYDYSATDGGRITSAGALQNAIWYLQGEVGDPGNVFSIAAVNEFGLAAATESVTLYGNDFNVEVMNLTDGNGSAAQNQLFLDPVPDGGPTVGLLGAALLALLLIGRRRSFI